MGKKNGLADPTQLKAVDPDGKGLLRVIIETPKGSRNKFAYNVDEHVFELKTVLPSGMEFPFDFGFVPRTKRGRWRSAGRACVDGRAGVHWVRA